MWFPANRIKYIASIVLIPYSTVHTSFPVNAKRVKNNSLPHLTLLITRSLLSSLAVSRLPQEHGVVLAAAAFAPDNSQLTALTLPPTVRTLTFTT